MSHELPHELYDEIISYLWNDKQTLFACSVAGRTLTIPSQKRLFSQIILPRPLQLDKYPTISLQLGHSYSNFERMLGQSPHIAGYIECLQIIAPSRCRLEISNMMDLDPWSNEEDSILLSCQPPFPKLKAVVVDYLGDWYTCPGLRSIIFPLLRLPSLVYVDLDPFPIPILTQVIGDNVKHLRFRFCPEPSNILFRTLPPVPIYLESLYITGVQSHPSFMRSDPNCRIKINRLRKVVVNMRHDELVAHSMTWTLLQSCADTLEELTIVPSPVCALDISPYQEETDLAKLTSLRKIEVWIDYDDHDDDGQHRSTHGFGWFTQLLLSCSSTNERLKEMTIITRLGLAYQTIIDVIHGPWKNITAALLGACFSGLKKLNIIFAHGYDIAICLGNIEAFKASEHMSKLRSRQGLDVNVTGYVNINLQPAQFVPDPRWEILW